MAFDPETGEWYEEYANQETLPSYWPEVDTAPTYTEGSAYPTGDGGYTAPTPIEGSVINNDPYPTRQPTTTSTDPYAGLPSYIPRAWAEDFIRRNPGDYSRIVSAYNSDHFSQTNIPGGTAPTGGISSGASVLPGNTYQEIYNNTIGNQSNMYPDWLRDMFQQQNSRYEAEAARRAASEEAIRASLMEMIRQGQTPVTPESVALSPEGRSFARLQDRAADALRAQAAERAGVLGVGGNQAGELSGALASQAAGGAREAQENIAGFQSQLLAREMQARRDQLMQALQMGAGLLDSESQRALQREVSQLDAAIRQNLGQGGLSLGLLNALLQNEQYNSNLGVQLGFGLSGLNQGFYNSFWG